jgi:hypothetical protein
MRHTDIPTPEDWEDLPEVWKARIESWRWPEMRAAILKLQKLERWVVEASEAITAAGVKHDRLRDVAPLLDAVRRARALLESQPESAAVAEGMHARIVDAVHEIEWEFSALMGELNARIEKQNALLADYWASLPQETLPVEMRDLVRQWLDGEREATLSRLTLEDRAEVEAQDRRNRGG